VGPIFGGILAGYVTFETPFFVCAVLMLIAGVIVWKKVSEPQRHIDIQHLEHSEII